MEAEGRRVRRSHFFLRDSLFSDLTKEAVEESDESSRSSMKAGLATLGLGGLVAGAYAIYKKSVSGDELLELPGQVMTDAQTDPEINADTGIENLKKEGEALPEFKEPEVKPVPVEPGFWQRIKNSFGVKTPPLPSSQVGEAMTSSKEPVSALVKKLPGEFRGRYAFANIVGARLLSEKGTYTAEEAKQIVALKASRSPTNATGTMPREIDALIRAYASKHSVDPELAVKIAKMESGGNPNAISSTGAIGVYQFTGRTANDYGIQNRFDPAQNIEGGILLLKASSSKLSRDEIPPTPTNLYLIHQLGYSGARELISAAHKKKRISELSPSLQKAIRLNAGGSQVKTAADYIVKTTGHFNSRAASVALAPETGNLPYVSTPSSAVATVQVEKVPPSQPATVVAQVDLRALEQEVGRSVTQTTEAPGSTPKPKPASNQSQKPQQVARLKNGTLVALT